MSSLYAFLLLYTTPKTSKKWTNPDLLMLEAKVTQYLGCSKYALPSILVCVNSSRDVDHSNIFSQSIDLSISEFTSSITILTHLRTWTGVSWCCSFLEEL